MNSQEKKRKIWPCSLAVAQFLRGWRKLQAAGRWCVLPVWSVLLTGTPDLSSSSTTLSKPLRTARIRTTEPSGPHHSADCQTTQSIIERSHFPPVRQRSWCNGKKNQLELTIYKSESENDFTVTVWLQNSSRQKTEEQTCWGGLSRGGGMAFLSHPLGRAEATRGSQMDLKH